MRKPREEMIAETRAKLIAAGRQAFGTVGYAAASMDDFTAGAGLTRGALYHHFGDKKGLLQAVIQEIDAEMTLRLNRISAAAPDRWQGFVAECVAYIEMALEPEIRRIVLRDGPSVLGDPASWPTANSCVAGMAATLDALAAEGVLEPLDSLATARMLTGASSYAAGWIANADDPQAVSTRATAGYRRLVEGLLTKPGRGAPA